MRLDEFLVKEGYAKSRERAKELIKSGYVRADGKIISKPSHSVSGDEMIEICGDTLKYVGRGGLKLEKAIKVFGISLEGKKCADFGASTGGFTDCMLQNGASAVYAVDVGHGQLDEKLRNDERVHNIEGLNLKDISPSDIGGAAEFIGCDLSFISVKLIMQRIYDSLCDGGEAVILVKPQFEAGRENVGKNGIVKSEKAHVRVLEEISASILSCGFTLLAIDYSPITGGDGNIEYLAHISKEKTEYPKSFDFKKTVAEAFLNKKGMIKNDGSRFTEF